jgi:hypothetical protein
MKDQSWRSIDIIANKQGEPHVLQQKVTVYTAVAIVAGRTTGEGRD